MQLLGLQLGIEPAGAATSTRQELRPHMTLQMLDSIRDYEIDPYENWSENVFLTNTRFFTFVIFFKVSSHPYSVKGTLRSTTSTWTTTPFKISAFEEITVYWAPSFILVACLMTPTTLQFSLKDCSLWMNSILRNSLFSFRELTSSF